MFLRKYLKEISLALGIAYALTLLVLALISVNANVISNNDKLLHSLEFFVFSVIILWNLLVWHINNKYLLALITILIFTLLSEFVQIFVLSRSFSAFDMLADLSGALLGFLFFFILEKVLFTKKFFIKI